MKERLTAESYTLSFRFSVSKGSIQILWTVLSHLLHTLHTIQHFSVLPHIGLYAYVEEGVGLTQARVCMCVRMSVTRHSNKG